MREGTGDGQRRQKSEHEIENKGEKKMGREMEEEWVRNKRDGLGRWKENERKEDMVEDTEIEMWGKWY